jgi:hypothetical protein
MYGTHEIGGEGTRPVRYGNFSDCVGHNAGIAPCLERPTVVWLPTSVSGTLT